MVSPAPRALRTPPARKEPPLADVTAVGKQNSRYLEVGMGTAACRPRCGVALGCRVLETHPSLQTPKSREWSLFLPRDRSKGSQSTAR